MSSLSLRHVYKIYTGNVKAVSDFNLEIDDKEFIVFVGPSGCGKSTTLRMIAGLEEISAGELYIDGKLMNDIEPKDRDIAMVFQNYALYPHYTVYENMAFGLRLRRMNRKEIDDRVKEAASILGISALLSRKPKALSGGQRQRVALGRAIVREPKVFLLDEPLSNLDAKLRVQMRTEITKLHHKLATTFIYVTHDQTEAMTMGTRIVVMKDGVIQQVDTPQFLYDSPENKFVASFLGSPQMNFFEHAVLSEEDGKLFCTFGENKVEVPAERAKLLIDKNYIGKEITMGIRPEDIHDEVDFIKKSPATKFKAHVDVMEKLGNETFLYMNVDGKEDYTVARVDARTPLQANNDVELALDGTRLHFFDNGTELTLLGVPRYNMIDATLSADENGVSVSFGKGAGKTTIALPEEVLARLVNPDLIGGPVRIGIAPDAVKEIGEEGDAEIKATIDFTDDYPRYVAVFNKVAGKDTPFVSKHAYPTEEFEEVVNEDGEVTLVSKGTPEIGDELKKGKKVTYFVNPADIMIFDPETGEKALAVLPITDNTVMAKATVKEGVVSLAIGKNNKISFVDGTGTYIDGTYALRLGYENIEISPEAVKANPRSVINGKIDDIDVLGNTTAIFVKVDGFDPYLTAIVEGTPKLNVGDKIKCVFNPENFVIVDEPVVVTNDAE